MTAFKRTFLFYFPILVLFFSCSAGINGVVMEGGAAEISVKTALGPRTLGLIRSIKGFMGDSSGGQILNGESISRSMEAAPGIRSAFLKNTSSEALEGTISISHVGDFLSSDDSKFITFSEGERNSSIVAVLDRNTAPLLISKFPPEVEEYLSALMAPVVLGERISRQEYLSLVAMVYGRPLADEIAAASIKALIEFPRPPKSVQGGKIVGKQAEFVVPLLDLLVLDQPLRYEVEW